MTKPSPVPTRPGSPVRSGVSSGSVSLRAPSEPHEVGTFPLVTLVLTKGVTFFTQRNRYRTVSTPGSQIWTSHSPFLDHLLQEPVRRILHSQGYVGPTRVGPLPGRPRDFSVPTPSSVSPHLPPTVLRSSDQQNRKSVGTGDRPTTGY